LAQAAPSGHDTAERGRVMTAEPAPAAAPVPAVPDPAAAQPAVEPEESVEKPIPLVNIANALTTLRVLLVPVFGACLIVSDFTHAGWQIAATVVFAVASITDYVDGWIARRRNLVTSFGKVADPIADKALTGTALVLLSAHDVVPWWVTVLILVRELGVTVLRFIVLRHGVIPASPGGKLKTMLQSIGNGWLLLPLPDPLAEIGLWVIYAAMVVTVVTGIDYVIRAIRLSRSKP
jgi:CDP-diacylglycerol--glycerol-3-phosphate 3-phosphatidyltransferase